MSRLGLLPNTLDVNVYTHKSCNFSHVSVCACVCVFVRQGERDTRPHHHNNASSELLILHLEVCTEEEGSLDDSIPPFLSSISLIKNVFHNRPLHYYSELMFIQFIQINHRISATFESEICHEALLFPAPSSVR